MTHATDDLKARSRDSGKEMTITIMSFGYKQGSPPSSNALFDVRFLKNPYWVPELRPLTGLDEPVQSYVMEQPAAQEFLNSVERLVSGMIDRLRDLDINEFSIAFGCTGGQHRSTTMACLLGQRIESNPNNHCVRVNRVYRELEGRENSP